MILGSKNRPHFLKRRLGFLFGIASAATFLLAPTNYAHPSVIKMPKPLPDIVKDYKSVTIRAGSVGINHIGLKERGNIGSDCIGSGEMKSLESSGA